MQELTRFFSFLGLFGIENVHCAVRPDEAEHHGKVAAKLRKILYGEDRPADDHEQHRVEMPDQGAGTLQTPQQKELLQKQQQDKATHMTPRT